MKNLLIFFFLICFACFTAAQSFTSSASKTTVGEGETFQVSFTFSGKDLNSTKNFNPPDFNKNFLLLSGPNHSTSMQIINGAVSASRTYSYYLQPRGKGNFIIGSAELEYEGKILKTEPLKIEVVQGSAPMQQEKKDENISAEIAENLFILAIADKQKIYQGEQATVTYKLYTRLDIASQMSVSKLPQYQGFWAEEIETSGNISFQTENYNGKLYRVGVLKKAALFPSQSGELSVSPFEIVVPIYIKKKSKSNNPFDDFFNDPFFGRTEVYEYKAKSNTIRLNVLPLPENNKPESFNGAVGKFSISSKIDKSNTKTNEPVTLNLEIAGTGNIKLLEIPKLQLPTGLEAYEPKVSDEINSSGKISGKKSIEYLIVPRIAGTKEIPPVSFSYFDPELKAYKELKTDSYILQIEQGEESSQYASDNFISKDIRYIKTDAGLSSENSIIIFKPIFWAASVVPLMALIALVFWKRKEDRLAGNVRELKFTRAQKIAKSRLKNAHEYFVKGEQEKFYGEIALALFGYLEDKFHIQKSEFTMERAVEELRKRSFDEEFISSLKELIERSDFIRFAPLADKKSEMEKMYNESSEIIIQIEKKLSGKNV